MEEIRRLYNAYVNSKDYAPYTEKSEQLHDRIVDALAEMLPNKEYAEVEENLNLYRDCCAHDYQQHSKVRRRNFETNGSGEGTAQRGAFCHKKAPTRAGA